MDIFSRINPRLELKVSKRARRMALRLDTHRRVVSLVIPPYARLTKAYDFARENKDWIREKLATLPEPVLFTDGAVIPVLGRNRMLHIFYDKNLKTTDIMMKPNDIIVVTNKRDPTARIVRFLKEQARDHITALAHEKADLIRRKVRQVQVRDTKSRWGSCGQDGHLCFSWRLIFAPTVALDYVVAHEVAHLAHMNHGKKFWALCEDLSLDYRAGKNWMRDHGHELMGYGPVEKDE